MSMSSKLMIAMILAIGFTASASAYAACSVDTCKDVKIEKLYVLREPAVYITTTGDESRLNCQLIDGRFIKLRSDHRNNEKIYSMLLSAKLADQDIRIRVFKSHDVECNIDYTILE